MALTLRQFHYFSALAEEENFGRAAKRVNISQPALSVQIQELETQLGGALVERGTRKTLLTNFGRQVLQRARVILGQVDELEQFARWQQGLGGQLRLGVIPTIAPYLLPASFLRLRQLDLQLDIRIRESETATLLAELQSGFLDVAVMALPSGAEGLVEVPLVEDRFLLAGSARRLASLGDLSHLRPSALKPENLLLLEDGHCLTDQALSACTISPGSHVDMRASSMSTLCRLVGEGFGLTLLPELALQAEQKAVPNLCVTRFSGAEPTRTIGLVRRKISVDDGWFNQLAEVLRAAAQEEIDHARQLLA